MVPKCANLTDEAVRDRVTAVRRRGTKETVLSALMIEHVALAPVSTIQLPTSPRSEPRSSASKLRALTSLRFFAAAMIVMLHAQGYFGAVKALERFTLTQGVCFFFVLSGFILTYAYGSLDRQRIPRFLVARLARIVPMHVVAFTLYVLLLPAWYRDAVARDTRGVGVLALLLLQAWIPLYRVQTAFNGVSWSLSVEVFFYLCFPLLLWRWRQTWRIKLALTFLVAVGMILIANHGLSLLPRGAEARDVVYFHPLARVWEFTVGVATAFLWQYVRPRIQWGQRIATLLELAVVAVTLLVMLESGAWARHLGRFAVIGPGGEAWLASSGFVCLPFAALICVMAFEQGGIARMLAWSPLVLLGEISYALYLLHLLICHYYVIHPDPFVSISPWLLFIGYWTIALLAAFVGWAVIEVPSRRAILKLWDRFSAGRTTSARALSHVMTRTPSRRVPTMTTLSAAAASAVLLLVFTGVNADGRAALPPPAILDYFAPAQGGAQIAIDTIGEHPAADDAATVVSRRDYPNDAIAVVGWSVDAVHHRPVRGILISVDEEDGSWAGYGSSRNDVSAQLGSTAYLHSGYIGMISLKDLPDGPHTITIKALMQGDGTYAEMHAFLVIV